MVRRTSWATRSSSIRAPSPSSAAQALSSKGLVTRGDSRMRVTRISKPNSVFAGSVTPVIGAAERKCGVAAKGMCPSPQNRPDVASMPTQPAPGT